TLAGIFAGRAAVCPDATAVEFEDETLTYRELDERSSRLARVVEVERQVGRTRLDDSVQTDHQVDAAAQVDSDHAVRS
ncbi:hypothetical protein GV794_29100, partial [Nocardia cyriacigeorgica]